MLLVGSGSIFFVKNYICFMKYLMKLFQLVIYTLSQH